MFRQPVIHVICSDRHRNGKTLLARVLVDLILVDGGDPFVFDADPPEGPLRAAFPGRTALVDIGGVHGQTRVFDTILGSPGRDYVIDLPARHMQSFCSAATTHDFTATARRLGYALTVLFVVDNAPHSAGTARQVRDLLRPDLLVPVRNAEIGSAYRAAPFDLIVDMPRLGLELTAIVMDRRFSFRNFMLGEKAAVPLALRPTLEAFLARTTADLRDIPPALSLEAIHSPPLAAVS